MFEDYKTKDSVVVVYTGEGKGKTTAGLGLTVRALGTGWRVAFIQFIKHWHVGEHRFFEDIASTYKDTLFFHKGGAGFYHAGKLSAKGVSDAQHKQLARETLKIAQDCTTSGTYNLVVCDEINNALHDGLISMNDIKKLLKQRHPKTSLCLTGRNFPAKLFDQVDIATTMQPTKHHFEEKFLANKGIDY